MNIPPGKGLHALIRVRDLKTEEVLHSHQIYLLFMSRCDTIQIGQDLVRPPSSAMSVSDRMEVFVPLKGIIDIDEERARLMKNLKKAQEELSAVNKKLANDSFMEKAPAEVVEKERRRGEELLAREKKIEAGLSALTS